MAVEHWENANKFDVLRDKYNNSVNEIGKSQRDATQGLAYLQDIIQGEQGISIDNSDPSGLLKILISGLSGNHGKYLRSNGTSIAWVGFDVQSAFTDLHGDLKPISGSSALTSALTVPNLGHNLTYMYIATFMIEKATTSPVHRLDVRLNGVSVKFQQVSFPNNGINSTTIAGIATNVVPGSTWDTLSTVIGSTNQYKYYNVDLTIIGIPT